MNRNELLKFLRAGHRMTHTYFSKHEWMQLTGPNHLIFEDGVVVTQDEFWNIRKGSAWHTGWSIYVEKLK